MCVCVCVCVCVCFYVVCTQTHDCAHVRKKYFSCVICLSSFFVCSRKEKRMMYRIKGYTIDIEEHKSCLCEKKIVFFYSEKCAGVRICGVPVKRAHTYIFFLFFVLICTYEFITFQKINDCIYIVINLIHVDQIRNHIKIYKLPFVSTPSAARCFQTSI